MKPTDVIAPQGRWKLLDVIYDGGDGEDSLAIGEWLEDWSDNGQKTWKRVLGVRWNGKGNSAGMPQSRGFGTWFIVPCKYAWAMIDALTPQQISPPKKAVAEALLPRH